MNEFSIRRATEADFPIVMPFLDHVFFPSEPGHFVQICPHLYSNPETAMHEAYLAWVGERLVGHVGVYPLRVKVGSGRELSIGGVGAVSAHADYRGKGIMSALLHAAIEGMYASGYDLSVLWGDRKRYLTFGWETVGRRMEWTFDARIARAAGTKPATLVAFDPEHHLNTLVHAWNADFSGTLHDARSMSVHMQRHWHVVFAAQSLDTIPTFACYQMRDGAMIVDKLAGAEEMLPAVLLSLMELEEQRPSKVIVRSPAAPHPVGRLAIAMNSELAVRPACHARVINAESLVAKLQATSLPSDLAEAVRTLFGTPAADAISPHNCLFIEELAHV